MRIGRRFAWAIQRDHCDLFVEAWRGGAPLDFRGVNGMENSRIAAKKHKIRKKPWF